jgi:hypothetical protein
MRQVSKHYFYVIPVLLALVAALAVVFLLPHPSMRSVYESKFQIPLFTGFLTMGGFLLSLKTFIIIKMNEVVYQSDAYVRKSKKLHALDPNFNPLSGLKNLNSFLLFCVKWSLSASFLQPSLGLLHNRYTTAICIGAAVGAACLVLSACFLIRANMTDLFTYWEDAHEDKLNKLD